jgi:hypothetical protein
MHVRGTPPTTKVSSNELTEYCRNFESKMAAFLIPVATINPTDYDKLGTKNAETYEPFLLNIFFFLSKIA